MSIPFNELAWFELENWGYFSWKRKWIPFKNCFKLLCSSTMVIDVEVSVSGSSSNLVTDSTCTLIHETLTNITYMRTVLRGKKNQAYSHLWMTSWSLGAYFVSWKITYPIANGCPCAPVALWDSLGPWGSLFYAHYAFTSKPGYNSMTSLLMHTVAHF